jgi:4-alpha-glucanotransferase
MTDPVNVPGTFREYPNWQRKVTASIEDMAARAISRRRAVRRDQPRVGVEVQSPELTGVDAP